MPAAQTNAAYLQIAINLDLMPVEHLLAGTGLTVESLSHLATVDTDVVVQVVNNLHNSNVREDWRTLFGGHIGMTSHGPVGFASLTAPTIGEAITTFVQWEKVQSQTYEGCIEQTAEGYEVWLDDTTGDEVFAEFLFEAFVKAMSVLLSQLTGNIDEGIEIFFKTSQRQDILNLTLAGKAHFAQPKNKLKISNTLWHLASPLANPELHELNLNKCRQMLAQTVATEAVDQRVIDIIKQHFDDIVLLGMPPSSPPTQSQICNMLHLTERTLIRKLKARQTSYKQIVENQRRQRAQLLLKEASLTVNQIAELLGYRDTANFCRAFKNWFGLSPQHFRRECING